MTGNAVPVSDPAAWKAFLDWLSGFGVLVSAISTIVLAVFARLQYRVSETTRDDGVRRDRSDRYNRFLAFSDAWTKVYEKRNDLLSAPEIVTSEGLLHLYGHEYENLLKTPDWRDNIRPILSFYEDLGLMLEQGLIEAKHLFLLVTVDSFEKYNKETAERASFPEGVMYERLKGYIEYLRKVYRPNIYEYYDKYLLVAYKKYAVQPPPLDPELEARAEYLIPSQNKRGK